MKPWNFILKNLSNNTPTTLLYVLDSKGSSPGRKGFLMAVNKNGTFEGTIGGGIMEVKMITLAVAKMETDAKEILVKKQFHDKAHSRNQSGLICSGEQTVAVIPLQPSDFNLINSIAKNKQPLFLNISPNGFRIDTEATAEKIQLNSETEFEIITLLKPPRVTHIFGAGHVGLALARQLSILGYRVIQYDDRPDLPSLSQNDFASEIKIIDYKKTKSATTIAPSDLVIIVSFSYRSDKLILRQLYNQQYAYIGMMGSDAKIATLRKELREEGISEADLRQVSMPIGLNIYAKTAEEIAVSIVGEIILRTNQGLPTGRDY